MGTDDPLHLFFLFRIHPGLAPAPSGGPAGHALMEEDAAWSHQTDGERDGDQLDRSERASLRRVAGLSTELEDVTEVEYRQLRLERVVLVGVWTDGTVEDAENSLRRARRARRDRRLGGARRRRPAPRQARPGDLHRLRQGRRAARHRHARPAPTP